jgi:hypothetical protein
MGFSSQYNERNSGANSGVTKAKPYIESIYLFLFVNKFYNFSTVLGVKIALFMETYVYQIKSAKGVHLDHLYQELLMIIDAYKDGCETTKLQLVPSANCILLTSNNLKLRASLIKDTDFEIS